MTRFTRSCAGVVSSATYAQTGSFRVPVQPFESTSGGQGYDDPEESRALVDLGERRLFRERISPYARFPAGLPPGFPRSTLRSGYPPVPGGIPPNIWQFPAANEDPDAQDSQ